MKRALFKQRLLTKATKWSNEIKDIDEKKSILKIKDRLKGLKHLTQLIDSSVSDQEYPDIGDIQLHIDTLN